MTEHESFSGCCSSRRLVINRFPPQSGVESFHSFPFLQETNRWFPCTHVWTRTAPMTEISLFCSQKRLHSLKNSCRKDGSLMWNPSAVQTTCTLVVVHWKNSQGRALLSKHPSKHQQHQKIFSFHDSSQRRRNCIDMPTFRWIDAKHTETQVRQSLQKEKGAGREVVKTLLLQKDASVHGKRSQAGWKLN